jgi:NAD(P)-dependent dehydrogenase (short-subunit alcohol dehydrogenase family)
MSSILITGGTDGIGRELARSYVARGDTVVTVGRDERKAVPGAGFIPADLSLVAENQRVIDLVNAEYGAFDAVVFCARYFRASRWVTADGIEGVFALDYLSRYLFSYGLLGPRVIVNVSGPGHSAGRIMWDDLMLERSYDGMTAQFQGGRANDLLGVSYASRVGDARYVLINPGMVSTGFRGEFDPVTAAHVERAKRDGQPVSTGILPIVARIDTPPAEPLSAFVLQDPLQVTGPAFARADADRLHGLTQQLLARVPG